MTKQEMIEIMERHLTKRNPPFTAPSAEQWEHLNKKFHCEFDPEFVVFMDVVSGYKFTGGLLNIAAEVPDPLSDSIENIYDYERHGYEDTLWPEDLIPFVDIGCSGDFHCFKSSDGIASRVYWYDHEDQVVTEEYPSFADWFRDWEAQGFLWRVNVPPDWVVFES